MLSHYVPKFVFKWLKDTSATGHIRYSNAPNKRVQDGPKDNLFCNDCEILLNKFEAPFADRIFHPYAERLSGEFRYEEWLMKFCISVSYRTLLLFKRRASISAFDADARQATELADAKWKRVLRGEDEHPGEFEQHILPLNYVSEPSAMATSDFLNRYLVRAIDTDIAFESSSGGFVFTKLGPIAIFGFFSQPTERWDNTRVKVRSGVFRLGGQVVSHRLGRYLNQRAERYKRVATSISATQNEKIDDAVLSNILRVQGSQQWAAMQSDAELFGIEAIVRKSQ
jgi:hypothetical protein